MTAANTLDLKPAGDSVKTRISTFQLFMEQIYRNDPNETNNRNGQHQWIIIPSSQTDNNIT